MTDQRETINYQRDGRIARITLNRPEKLNAISRQLQTELLDALSEAEADDAVHVALVAGAGRAFSAGYDLVSRDGVAASPGVRDRARPRRARAAAAQLAADLGPAPAGCRSRTRALPRRRHAAGGDLRRHVRR